MFRSPDWWTVIDVMLDTICAETISHSAVFLREEGKKRVSEDPNSYFTIRVHAKGSCGGGAGN